VQAVILAGGLATRLRPITERVPKSLIKIYDKPFLQYQLERLRDEGVTDIILCLGHLGDQIEKYFGDGRKYGVNITYSHDGKHLLGTGGALKKAERYLSEEFFLTYGDSYLFIHYRTVMSWFKKLDKQGLMVVYKNCDQYDKSNVSIEGNLVKSYSKTNKTKDMIYIDYGASLLRRDVLNLVPEDAVCSLEELFAQLIEQQQLLAYEVKERFYQIGSVDGIEEFKQYISWLGGKG
jgi:MurNAc alpha-1-phosphate uridylyltransferase